MTNVEIGLPDEMRAAVRREVVSATAKWAIGFLVLLLGFALSGWWFFLKPRLIDLVGGVPAGAVMPFDRAPANPCPTGWEVFKEATSRAIIGAGDSANFYEPKFARDERGRPLTPRAYREHGGEEIHQLTVDEMPTHAHSYGTESGTDGNRSGQQDATYSRISANTGSAGGDQPHNNMPPYVALYFCVKR